MRRYSLYVTAEAAEALDEAVTTVRQALGADTPRHVALSALLHAAAEQADTVASRLAKQRAHELTEQLEHLQSTAPDG
jgi:N-acetylglucosamine kinase-like BadF-type ATPase